MSPVRLSGRVPAMECKKWSRRESNPRPKSLSLGVYMLFPFCTRGIGLRAIQLGIRPRAIQLPSAGTLVLSSRGSYPVMTPLDYPGLDTPEPETLALPGRTAAPKG